MRRKALRKAETFFVSDDFEEWKERWARKHADNLAKCSCWMCGNPRKHFKDTSLQEKRFSQREKFCEES